MEDQKETAEGAAEVFKKMKKNSDGVPTWCWIITWGMIVAALVMSFMK